MSDAESSSLFKDIGGSRGGITMKALQSVVMGSDKDFASRS